MGGNKIIKTTNGGNTWIQYTHEFAYSGRYCMVDSLVGYGASSSISGTKVFKTSDGGETWFLLLNNHPVEGISGVFFSNRNIGCVMGSTHEPRRWYIFKTTNGGYNWNQALSSEILISGFNSFKKDTLFAHSAGILYISNNSGMNWLTVETPGNTINDVSFPDNDTGYSSGRAGTLRVVNKTTNGGLTWTQILNYPTTANLGSIFFVNLNVGYIAGTNGLLLKTTNGGLTPVVNLNTVTPEKYNLHQNYPNPFNPVTKIKFDVALSSKIKLVVYNSLGKEMEVLVNRNMNAGSYETQWNAESFSSGIYYYSLFINNNLIDTKKTVLIK